MAVIGVQPFVLKDCTLTIATDEYQAHVSQVEFQPSASTVNWKGLTPAATYTDVTTATWTATLAYAQDWTTADSLAYYLHENEGETVSATFVPLAGGPTVSASLVITPGAIGGTVDQFAVATVTLGVVGKPTITPPEES